MSDILGDQARLQAVRRSALMDSEPEEVFDRLTRLVSKLLGAPVATMTLVDRDRQGIGQQSGLHRRIPPAGFRPDTGGRIAFRIGIDLGAGRGGLRAGGLT